MWPEERSIHCTDEQLLAYLDKELSEEDGCSVDEHVSRCWNCRARMAELENYAQRFARAFSGQQFPGPGLNAEARVRFTERVREIETKSAKRSLLWLKPRPRFRFAVAAAITVGVCLASLTITPVRTAIASLPDRIFQPPAEEVLKLARRVESAAYIQPFHRSYRVEIGRGGATASGSTTRLQLWSALAGFRFTTRGERPDGTLRHAYWQPSPGRGYVSDQANPGLARLLPPAPPALHSLTAIYLDSPGNDCAECLFDRWLESNRWRPAYLSRELAVEAERPGSPITLEKIDGNDGDSFYRLRADRVVAGQEVITTLDVDRETRRPQRLSWSVRRAGAEFHIRIEMLGQRPLLASENSNQTFEPDVPVLVAVDWPEPPRELGAVELSSVTDLLSLGPDEAAILEAEVEARYGLHIVGACLGEPVELTRGPGGRLSVVARVASQKRKDELLWALDPVRNLPWVTLDVSTLAEIAEALPVPEGSPSVQDSDPISTVEKDRHGPLPIEEHLRRFLAEQGERAPNESTAPISEQIVSFANRAYSTSEDLIAHAWALRRLSDAYGAPRPIALRPRSRWLLEVMIQDHANALHQQAAELSAQLLPFLEGIPLQTGIGRERAVAPPRGWGWGNSNRELFDTAQRMHRLVLALFAGAQMPARIEPANDSSAEIRVRVPGTEEAARELSVALKEVGQKHVVSLEDAGQEFPGLVARRTGLISHRPGGDEIQESNP